MWSLLQFQSTFPIRMSVCHLAIEFCVSHFCYPVYLRRRMFAATASAG